jgi:hypothetical protein
VYDYEILYDLPAGRYEGAGISGIRTKTVRSGALLEVMAYPIAPVSQAAKREARRRHTGPAQEKLNARNAQRHMERLIEANFTQMDHVVTLTYAYPAADWGMASLDMLQAAYERAGVPWDIEAAARDYRNFMARLRRAEKRAGGDPKAVKHLYVIESGKEPEGGGLPCKYHIHAVIHAPSLLPEQIRDIWGKGFTRCDRLELRYGGAARLSKYMTKQRRYERRWGHSRGMIMPTVTVSDRKMSRRRAARVASDVMAYGRTIFEAMYKGYACAEDPVVTYSDFRPGAYIYARMRRRD